EVRIAWNVFADKLRHKTSVQVVKTSGTNSSHDRNRLALIKRALSPEVDVQIAKTTSQSAFLIELWINTAVFLMSTQIRIPSISACRKLRGADTWISEGKDMATVSEKPPATVAEPPLEPICRFVIRTITYESDP